MKRLMTVALLGVAALALTGCATGEEPLNGTMTVEQAKEQTLRLQNAIVAEIEESAIAGVDQAQDGTLLACSTERSHSWTGRTDVTLTEEASLDRTLSLLADHFENRDGMTVERDQSADGEPRVTLIAAAGDSYLVGLWRDEHRIEILAFSECFVLPESLSPGGRY